MKKHDEGYALVLVLVVMVVLCLVATSVLAIALNNLKKQEASVARMQAKYEAQAKIEEFYANLQYDMLERATAHPILGPEGENVRYFISNDDVEYINRNGIVEIAALVQPEADADNQILGSGIYIAVEAFGENGKEKVRIICELVLESDTIIKDETTDVYMVFNPVLGYSTYEVTVVTPEEGGDGA